jgi:hypothetical protein
MKKILLLLWFCFSSLNCFSAENFDFSKISTMSMTDIVKNIQDDPSYNEEMLVEMLFTIPVEYHQYIMPMVGNMRSISEKVRMMPGIVEWRRRIPTRLPVELNEFAQTHLKYLDPVWYPLLMPESWPSFTRQQEKEHDHTHIPLVLDVSTPEKMEAVFPSNIDPKTELWTMLHPSSSTTNNKDENPITANDISSVMNIMEKFKELQNTPNGNKIKNTILFDFKDQDVLLDAFVNPCASLVNRFQKVDTDGWLELQLKKENMAQSDYIEKCDRVVKAYRVKNMSSDRAKEIVRLTHEAMELPKDSFYRKIYLTLSHMHRANLADVRALKGYDDSLRKTFSQGMMIMSTPFMLDF